MIGSLAAVGLVDSAPVAAQQADPVPRPINECITRQADGSFDIVFGWEIPNSGNNAQPDGSVSIPIGPDNSVSVPQGGTLVNGPPTFFDKPVGGSSNPRHVVWPPFVWDPPGGAQRTGRTPWWPWLAVVVNVQPGQMASWTLSGTTVQQTADPTNPEIQRCSQHIIIAKSWDGFPTPPPELDKQAYEIEVRMTSNPIDPLELNSGVATCKYLEYQTPSAQFAPFGEGFTTTETDTLNCWYNNELRYASDIGGYWIPKGGVYEVSEAGLPPGWAPVAGIGTGFVADFQDPSAYSNCGVYPAFGTPAAKLDSNGAVIPQFGRASNKWCMHLVENEGSAPPTTTTTTVPGSTTTVPGSTTTTVAGSTTTIAGPTTTGPQPTLPSTGSGDDDIAALGLVSLLLGAMALIVSRRVART